MPTTNELFQNKYFIIGYLVGQAIRMQAHYNIDVEWLDEENGILYVKNAGAFIDSEILNILEVF